MSTTLRSAGKRSEEDRRLDQQLRLLVRGATNPEDASHRQMIKVMAHAVNIPPLRTRLVKLLLERLRVGSEAGRSGAADVLAAMGTVVIPTLVQWFIRTRSANVQIQVVEVLARVVGELSPERHFPIQVDLHVLAARWGRGPEVARAVAMAQDRFRPTKKELRRGATHGDEAKPGHCGPTKPPSVLAGFESKSQGKGVC